MNLLKKVVLSIFIIVLSSCAEYKIDKLAQKKEKQFYSSKGFALIYEDNLYQQKIINRKINNDQVILMHSFLKKNTPIKIINPVNSKVLETRVHKIANYPKIFNIVISKKAASILDLDIENPYLEVFEIKKNITFVAKESNTFEEEKNVAEKAPVQEIQVDTLTSKKVEIKEKIDKKNKYVLVISDFYYLESAVNLKKKLTNSTQINNFLIKKVNNNKYRLSVGPFENFNSLKYTYISLNNLGFDDLNIYTIK